MYNSEKKGTDAYYAMQEFVDASESLTEGSDKFESAAENACTTISQLCEDLDDKQIEIDELEAEIEILEDRCKDKLKTDDAIEFIRVLKNVQVYVADHIQVLEKKYGEGIKAKADEPN